MIEPELAPPAPRPRPRRRAVVAGAVALALVGGIAVATNGGRSEPAPLALVAGNSVGTGGAEKAATPGAAAPAVAGGMASADSRSFAPGPYGGWGLTFKVDGELPSLPGHAAAWTVSGPALDRAAVARIAGALGVSGTPEQRDGGWFVDNGDWTLAAYPGGDTWSISYYRSRTAAGDDAAASGPALSAADAERQVRDLLDHMGAPDGSWKIETTETDIGVGWACAAPALSSDELTKLEAEKPAQVNQANPAADKPAPDIAVAPCPPPPAPVKGFNVALYPVLDGHRAGWPVWNVTLRSDGRIENLYGSWATFQRGGDYKLRGVDVALKELQSPPQPPIATGGIVTDSPAGIASDAVTSSSGSGSMGSPGSAGSVPGRLPTDGGNAVSPPGVATPAMAPVCGPMPMPMPMPAEKATSSFAPACVAQPQVVTITGVELGLLQASVFEGGRVRLHLVPAYRFLGHFDNGTPWETSVIALHPDAIASAPNIPVADKGRETGIPAIGKAVPPTPPAPETITATPAPE